MPLRLKVKGATKEELARGAAAAVAFLQLHGVTPEQAVHGAYMRYDNDIAGFSEEDPDFGEREQQWARLLDEAYHVAMKACCRGWDEIPLFGNLDMYPDDPPLH